jgi:dCMP deaminase
VKQKLINAYMSMAETFAKCSTAKRLQVGAIVVKEDRIISIGYNGMPSGWNNNCEGIEYMNRDAGGWLDPNEIYEQWPLIEEDLHPDLGYARRYKLVTKPEVIHAEANAIAKLAKSTESGDGAVMFLTHAPCMDCAKQVYAAGIRKVYFGKQYRSADGIDFLNKCNIEVEQWTYGDNT